MDKLTVANLVAAQAQFCYGLTAFPGVINEDFYKGAMSGLMMLWANVTNQLIADFGEARTTFRLDEKMTHTERIELVLGFLMVEK
jgi:hypothetical protein